MSHTIHYYLSPISPFTCLAGNLLEREAPAEVVYHPFDIGRLFAATGGVPVPQRSPQRQAYRLAELGRIQKQRGITINLKPKNFPVDGRPASKLLLAVRDAGSDVPGLARALLSAVWQRDLNIAEDAVLARLLDELGIDSALLEQSKGLDDQLDKETDEAIEAGVFGSPFYIVDGEPFWGQDRLEQAIERAKS
ncbi:MULTISPECIES: 2-hydroxychromene-2-carboxylate isomerase [unclassified Marinobacterium]|uniref:2-hydroxychromene-2-carboxylate isomerase n=1 Tax=unclassified Marinobacterium TaxID=2644139 RepID=UPI001568F990|nr:MULTISPECIES: 2-hydroxychromene-2-carboxylate isomerase [unclassified Marinobacterium]NRP51929.1 2-hydroxychromene-2-carboxylate isomerase [Marinobacterium sp. xm-v-242]NRP56978.1 2-hydroxychromene-2-carboxylate isomerase [Marinobacterium sp. xm-d-510]NRP76510.1 2-hydroxychromene-2-carboxylate isomerase [Marinobacterium sp. xm-m-383]NRP97772.1 2-hydroxychromene-2-carboxylate isomerase [Marinobacterium sp. xm-a-127]